MQVRSQAVQNFINTWQQTRQATRLTLKTQKPDLEDLISFNIALSGVVLCLDKIFTLIKEPNSTPVQQNKVLSDSATRALENLEIAYEQILTLINNDKGLKILEKLKGEVLKVSEFLPQVFKKAIIEKDLNKKLLQASRPFQIYDYPHCQIVKIWLTAITKLAFEIKGQVTKLSDTNPDELNTLLKECLEDILDLSKIPKYWSALLKQQRQDNLSQKPD